MAKKTYNEKLHSSKDLPKIVDLTQQPETMKRLKGRTMLVASPLEYNQIMEAIPLGRVATADQIRAFLAHAVGADITCPLTAGIFINVCAHASEERTEHKLPWWRTLKSSGELNAKYPGGIEAQRRQLKLEGFTINQKGKRYFVADYENQLADLLTLVKFPREMKTC